MDGMLNKLKNLDAYPKVNEDFFTRTYSGGVITVVSSLVMLCLFISELSKPSVTSFVATSLRYMRNCLWSDVSYLQVFGSG